MSSWDELYRLAVEALGDCREARWIVEEASGFPLGRADGPVRERPQARFEAMVERRRRGEPLQYVLGQWPFRQVELMVDARVLIPRPETEQVVEVALAELDRLRAGAHPDKRWIAVDLGTGTGAIALSLAKERPGVEVWAVDSSPGAVDVARANLAGLGGFAATRVRIERGDWWAGLPVELMGGVDVVVSNPPYISSSEMPELDPVVRDWEPREALESGPSGTEAIEAVLSAAGAWLAPRAAAVVEIAPHQAEEVAGTALRAGFSAVRVEPDLAGRPRALVARWGRL
jgi:release factor glutamine methyltransferase